MLPAKMPEIRELEDDGSQFLLGQVLINGPGDVNSGRDCGLRTET